MEIIKYQALPYYENIPYGNKTLDCVYHYTQEIKKVDVHFYRGHPKDGGPDYNLSQDTIENICKLEKYCEGRR